MMTYGSTSWTRWFISLCHFVSKKSKDRSTKVGAVIVGPDNEVVSIGYNGFARKVDDSIETRHARPDKYLWTEHAERNAIYNAARKTLKGTTLYMGYGPCPCTDCTRAIIQSGIAKVVMPGRPELNFPGKSEHWEHDFNVAIQMLQEAGVEIQYDMDYKHDA